MITIILGTRPEIIKMSPVIKEIEKNGLDYFVIHTGQHYSYELDQIFFEELNLPKPKYNLNVGSGTHAEQTGKILVAVEKILLKERPELVLVHGDTNTTLAGALASAKLQIPLGHVEAGLRSFDKRMPEEINRVLVDHLSDYLFAPTNKAEQNLIREGIEKGIFVTGNTIVDAIYQNLEIAKERAKAIENLNLKPKNYFLVTIHRQENVDFRERLEKIIMGLKLVQKEFSIPIVFPIHPRTRKMVKEFGINLDGIDVIDPVGFMDFLQLESNAKLILTDSGGVQEESCILGVPCVTLRDSTERPETIEVGANALAGIEPHRILDCVKKMVEKSHSWRNPLGDGKAGERIVKIISEVLK